MAQTYSNWEVIIVDDGSTDSSRNIATSFSEKDSRFSFSFRNRKPAGAPTCRNIAFEKSNGQYVIFLDSDDLLAHHCLKQRVDFINNHQQLDFLVFPMLIFTKEPADAEVLWNRPNERSDLLRFLLLDAPWQTSGPIWKRTAVEQVKGFTEGLACWQDVDFHLKALIAKLNYQVFFDANPDVFYRRHLSGSISQGEISTPPKMNARLKIFIDHTNALMIGETNNQLRLGAKEMGGNVVFGAIKALNFNVAKKAILHGIKIKLFNLQFLSKSMLLALIYFFRLNKLNAIEKKANQMIRKNRTPSTIGFHPYKFSNHE